MDLIKLIIYLLLFFELYGLGFYTQYHKELNLDNLDYLPLKPLLVDGFVDPFKRFYSVITFNPIKSQPKIKPNLFSSPYSVISFLLQCHKLFEPNFY